MTITIGTKNPVAEPKEELEQTTEEQPTVTELKEQIVQLEKERDQAVDTAVSSITLSTATLILLVAMGIKYIKEHKRRVEAESIIQGMTQFTHTMLEQQVYMMGMVPTLVIEVCEDNSSENPPVDQKE